MLFLIGLNYKKDYKLYKKKIHIYTIPSGVPSFTRKLKIYTRMHNILNVYFSFIFNQI